MNKDSELVKHVFENIEQILKDANVPERWYSIGRSTEMTNCIDFVNNEWIIYYVEKGNKLGIETFPKDKYNAAALSYIRKFINDKEKINELPKVYSKNKK